MLFIDIETVPDESRAHLFGLDPLPPPPPAATDIETPLVADLLGADLKKIEATLDGLTWPDVFLDSILAEEAKAKKPRKGVGDAVAKARAAAEAHQKLVDDRRKLLSVDPDYLRIVALGWAVGAAPVESLVVDDDDSVEAGFGVSEFDLLTKFWEVVFETNTRPIVGFNVSGFDLPALFMRSALLGVKAPPQGKLIDCSAYKADVCDLMHMRYGQFKRQPKGLKTLARLMNVPIPAGDVDGSMTETLWRTDPARLGEYVRSDVEITRVLYHKLRFFFFK